MKSKVLRVILALLFLSVFNALFFYLCGIENTTNQWITYGFIHFAYLCILITPMIEGDKKGQAVLKYNLYARAFTYFMIELAIGILLLIFNPIDYTWPLIGQSAIAFLFLVFQIAALAANDATEKSLNKQKAERIYVRTLAEQVKAILPDISDDMTKKSVVKAYEALCNSPLESFPEVKNIEEQLQSAVYSLCEAFESGNTELVIAASKSVQNKVRMRNSVIKQARMS